jgi:anti-anti-sigma regulatory factor
VLRLTTNRSEDFVTLQLEGKLAGPWVQELDKAWLMALDANPEQAVRCDLTGVTFIDAAGKELLTDLYSRGAKFMARGCLMRALVAEIAQGRTK